MKSKDSVVVQKDGVVIYTGTTTVTVNFAGDKLVSVNRDNGGPTEIIKR